jgi:hypothetical protein
MPEAGRPAASAGNAYHDVTTALRLVEMLRDSRIEYVWPEAVEPVDDIKISYSDGSGRFEQVKEHAPGKSWSPAALFSEGVLGQFLEQHATDSRSQLVLVTASDAREMQELATRAESALHNNPGDPGEALREWFARLTAELRDVVAHICERTKLSSSALLGLLAVIRIEDNQGRIDQRRANLATRLHGLVTHPGLGAKALEDLAREASIRRDKLRRIDVEEALTDGQAEPLKSAWALHVDLETYAGRLDETARILDASNLPDFDRVVKSGAVVVDVASIPGPIVIVAGHGAGKTRLSLRLAATWLRSGRHGLHVMLGGWATDLADLIRAELAAAAQRAADDDDLSTFLSPPGSFVLLDSLDEVSTGGRGAAIREVQQFARMHPHIHVIATARPGVLPQRLPWLELELEPLDDGQVKQVLGHDPWHLPSGLQVLAGNPLMLGLLKTQGDGPASEASLLDGYIATLIDREANRPERFDALTGARVAVDTAYRWLLGDRLSLDDGSYRQLAAEVARGLQESDNVTLDARAVEAWLVDIGLVVRPRGQIRPLHRTLLDQLAARRFADPGGPAGPVPPALREAFARYIGTLRSVDDRARELLHDVERDVELLARCRHLVRADVVWPCGPSAFADDYHSALRTVTTGPLRGAGIVPAAVQVRLDRALTWISERETPRSATDTVEVVENSGKMYLVGKDGVAVDGVLRFAGQGFEGRAITVPIPQLVAYERARDKLQDRVAHEILLDEGPHITYERLAAIPARLSRLATALGSQARSGYAPAELAHVTPSQLLDRFVALAADVMRREPTEEEKQALLVGYDFQVGTFFVVARAEPDLQDPYDPVAARPGLVLHSAPLLLLIREAERLGIAHLPLHPLGVLPENETDLSLQLPDRVWELHGNDLQLFVERQERGTQRAVKYLVTHNLAGLADTLPTFCSLPWRVTVIAENRSTSGVIDLNYSRRVQRNADAEAVYVEVGIPTSNGYSERGDLLFRHASVKKTAYRQVAQDLQSLLSGQRALGSEDLA